MLKLIVGGDSNSDLNFRSTVHPDWDFSFKKWPQYVAEHLGMELVCVGKGGRGNEYIYHSLLHEIIRTPQEEIGLVMVGWSQAMRKDWLQDDRWFCQRTNNDGDLLGWVTTSLDHYISFQFLCENFDLPYHHWQMTDLFEGYLGGLTGSIEPHWGQAAKMNYPGNAEKDELKVLTRITEYDDVIDNFMGWPGLRSNYKTINGGFNLLEKVIGDDRQKQLDSGCIVSELDDHPNEAGHKAIAKFLIKELNL